MAGPTQVVRTTVARRATTPNALLQSAEVVPSDGMMPAPGAGGHGFGEEQGREDSGTRTTGGAPGRTRTCDPRLRRPVLYPTELRAHMRCRLSVTRV